MILRNLLSKLASLNFSCYYCLMKQKYELAYIISSKISEEESQEISRRINNLIQEKGGIVSESQLPKKIALGYPIKKQVFAWFQTTYFSLDSSFLSELVKNLKEEKDILRHLALKVRKPRIKKPARTPRKPQLISKENEPSPKVELGEIEKRLDEILKDPDESQ